MNARARLTTDPARSALMRRVRRTRTTPEDAVARALRETGVAYRRNVRALPGSPDFANRRRGWAIFVNGCYWHRHTNCARATTPKRNNAFWVEKFDANRKRDARKIMQLRARGMRILLIWECETIDPARLGDRLTRFFAARQIAANRLA